MLGMLSLTPLLKGWQNKTHLYEKTVLRGETSDPWRISETGWLLSILLISTDAYGTVRLERQDADLQTESGEVYAEAIRLQGGVQQDPSGWVQRYFRPDPNSTFGYYVSPVFTGGFQGAVLPYVPTTTISLRLGSESTQTSAYIAALALAIAITDKKAFTQSLRQVLNSQADIEIPKEILSLGPVTLVQQPNKTDLLLEQILEQLRKGK